MSSSSLPEAQPSPFNYILGFLLVGAAWGLTTPFMRRAAIDYTPPERTFHGHFVRRKTLSVLYAILDMLRRPSYLIPFLLNITGSVWFFLLVGKAGE